MSIRAIEGVIENGKVRLRDDVSLPENTQVYVIVPETRQASPAQVQSPRLAHPEQAADFRKQVMEVRADARLGRVAL